MVEYRQRNEDSPPPPPAGLALPVETPLENYDEILTDILNSRNLQRLPTTSLHIRAEILSTRGVRLTTKFILRELKQMNCSFIKGRKRDPPADDAGTINFRAAYLAKKAANYNWKTNSKKPEVYLDENYCNKNHVAGRSWLLPDRVRYMESGRGERYCIVGAMVVFMRNGQLKGEWVRDSLRYWPAKNSPKEDYHGNFDAELFEKCFFNLCLSLLIDYGACRIHVDGAGYHKRNLHPHPTQSWNKDEIQVLLEDPEIYYEPKYTKKELLALVETQRKPPLYAAVEIARSCGHEVIYTPSYHPELQPIELEWAMLKNWIALNPAGSMEDLGLKIRSKPRQFTLKNFVGFYRHVQRQEKLFREQQQEQEEN